MASDTDGIVTDRETTLILTEGRRAPGGARRPVERS